MPWSYEEHNIPDSMKYLKPSIQKRAIKIANRVLESSGGDEGLAIAVGIKNAKKAHDKKGLVKMASLKLKPQTVIKFNNFLKKNNESYHKLVHKLKQRYDNESY